MRRQLHSWIWATEFHTKREAGMDTDAVSSPADLRDAPDLFGLALGWPKHDFGLL